MRDVVSPPKGADVRTLQILTRVINAERCERPPSKGQRSIKRPKTKHNLKQNS